MDEKCFCGGDQFFVRRLKDKWFLLICCRCRCRRTIESPLTKITVSVPFVDQEKEEEVKRDNPAVYRVWAKERI